MTSEKSPVNEVMQRLRQLDRVLAKADGIVGQPFEDRDDAEYFKSKLTKYLKAKLALVEHAGGLPKSTA